MKIYKDFLVEFFRNPNAFGAVMPSSQTLVKKMVKWIDFAKVDVAIEYGPGSGKITKELLKRLKPGSTFFSIEINRFMVKNLRKNIPEATFYNDSVINVRKYLKKYNKKQADLIISGLPWANFSTHLQNEILEKTFNVLSQGGTFITYAYCHGTLLPAGKMFKYLLYQYFDTVRKSSAALLNVPPAFVYHCEK